MTTIQDLDPRTAAAAIPGSTLAGRRARAAHPHAAARAGLLALAAGALLWGGFAQAQATAGVEEPVRRDVPFVPTPERVVEAMLRLANVGPEDKLYDLGSGDGRIVITAAQKFGTPGVGIDIDPRRIEESNANAERAGVTDKVEFRRGDLFEADFSDATVVTLYLLPGVNQQLKPRLLNELAPGTRVVSHAFDMGDWKPEKTQRVGTTTIYFWVVPERARAAEAGDAPQGQAKGQPAGRTGTGN